MNVGHWTPEADEWYFRHRKEAAEGTRSPSSLTQWRSLLRLTRASPRLTLYMNMASLAYLKDSSSAPLRH
jgi:hypothetical protein